MDGPKTYEFKMFGSMESHLWRKNASGPRAQPGPSARTIWDLVFVYGRNRSKTYPLKAGPGTGNTVKPTICRTFPSSPTPGEV